MFIKTILSQSRRDFSAIYECEHCGATYEASGYDDTNFHVNVIPSFVCHECGKIADKEYYEPMTPKYPDYQTV